MGLDDYEAELADESRRQRAVLRHQRMGDERDLVASLDASRRLGEVLLEALHDVGTLEAVVAGRTFTGAVHHVGDDLLTLVVASSAVVDIALCALDAWRVVGAPGSERSAATASHPSCIRDCLLILEAIGAEVEVPAADDKTLQGRVVRLGRDHVVLGGRPNIGDWFVATGALAYLVVRNDDRRRGATADAYLDARAQLFGPG